MIWTGILTKEALDAEFKRISDELEAYANEKLRRQKVFEIFKSTGMIIYHG